MKEIIRKILFEDNTEQLSFRFVNRGDKEKYTGQNKYDIRGVFTLSVLQRSELSNYPPEMAPYVFLLSKNIDAIKQNSVEGETFSFALIYYGVDSSWHGFYTVEDDMRRNGIYFKIALPTGRIHHKIMLFLNKAGKLIVFCPPTDTISRNSPALYVLDSHPSAEECVRFIGYTKYDVSMVSREELLKIATEYLIKYGYRIPLK